jgi:hypothetical protein
MEKNQHSGSEDTGVWQGVGHGLLKVSPGPTMPEPSTLCRRATPDTALRQFQRWPTRSAGCLRLSSTSADTPRRTPIGFRRVGGGRSGGWTSETDADDVMDRKRREEKKRSTEMRAKGVTLLEDGCYGGGKWLRPCQTEELKRGRGRGRREAKGDRLKVSAVY